jgi:hypothetical protein
MSKADDSDLHLAEGKDSHDGTSEGSAADAKSSSKAEKLEPEELVKKVQDYFFGNDDLAKTFEKFVKSKAHIIDLDSEEFKLEYTTIFNEYAKSPLLASVLTYRQTKIQDLCTYLTSLFDSLSSPRVHM